MRLGGKRAWWRPCTTNRPASTGVRASRLALTQSRALRVENVSERAAASPAIAATRLRNAVLSGGRSRCSSTAQRPSGSSTAAAALSRSSVSAKPLMSCCAVISSVTRRAAYTASREGVGDMLSCPTGRCRGYEMTKQRCALPVWTALLALAAGLCPPAAKAQDYPARRITIVVPYTAGSGFDTVARTIGQKISERWGQPVVIDNKAGASGNIGAETVANAPPDGYTLLMTGAPLTVSASVSKTRFDPVASFSALGNVGS